MIRSWFSSTNPAAKERFARRFIRHLGVPYEEAFETFSNTSFHILPLLEVDTTPLSGFMQDLGFKMSQKHPDVIVIVTDSFLTSAPLDALIHSYVSNGTACLPLEIGIVSMAGPYLSPSSDTCWMCFKNSLNRHNAVPQMIARMHPKDEPDAHETAYPELLLSQCFQHGVQTLLDALIGKSSDDVLTVRNHATGMTERCSVIRWVPCEACLKPRNEQESTQPELHLDRSISAIEASATTATLEENTKTLQSITNPYTGVVATLSPIETDENQVGLYRVASRHPLLNRLDESNFTRLLDTLHFNTNMQSSALGDDPNNTLVRAGNEAYEKCATAYRGDEYHRMATYEELGDQAIKNISLFPLSVHTDVSVPELPDSELIAWIPSWSLTHEKARWVPAAYCYFGFPSGKQYAYTNTRGIAAGPTFEFCVLKGLAELIETLAYTRWENNHTAVPEVDLSYFENSLFNTIQDYHTKKGRELWVLDLSGYATKNYYAYAVLSHDPKDDSLLLGTAAGHSPEHTVRSALLECTQMLPNLLLPLEEQKKSRDVRFGLEERHRRGVVSRGAQDAGRETQGSLTLRDVVAELHDEGIEVLVKDLTRAEVPIRVARVLFALSTPGVLSLNA